MATMKLIVSVAILVIGAATLGSAQWRRQNNFAYQQYYPQQQQIPYQNQYPKGQTGVSVSDTEWVCKNPKTGDMLVIVAEDVPSGIGQGQWQQQQQQRSPNNQPVQPGYPNYPQPSPIYPTTQAPIIQGTTPNTGGDGVIDIRMAKK